MHVHDTKTGLTPRRQRGDDATVYNRRDTIYHVPACIPYYIRTVFGTLEIAVNHRRRHQRGRLAERCSDADKRDRPVGFFFFLFARVVVVRKLPTKLRGRAETSRGLSDENKIYSAVYFVVSLVIRKSDVLEKMTSQKQKNKNDGEGSMTMSIVTFWCVARIRASDVASACSYKLKTFFFVCSSFFKAPVP